MHIFENIQVQFQILRPKFWFCFSRSRPECQSFEAVEMCTTASSMKTKTKVRMRGWRNVSRILTFWRSLRWFRNVFCQTIFFKFMFHCFLFNIFFIRFWSDSISKWHFSFNNFFVLGCGKLSQGVLVNDRRRSVSAHSPRKGHTRHDSVATTSTRHSRSDSTISQVFVNFITRRFVFLPKKIIIYFLAVHAIIYSNWSFQIVNCKQVLALYRSVYRNRCPGMRTRDRSHRLNHSRVERRTPDITLCIPS